MNYRSLLVDKVYGKKTGCMGCYKSWVLSVDAKLMFFFLIFVYFAFVLKNLLLKGFIESNSFGFYRILPN